MDIFPKKKKKPSCNYKIKSIIMLYIREEHIKRAVSCPLFPVRVPAMQADTSLREGEDISAKDVGGGGHRKMLLVWKALW